MTLSARRSSATKTSALAKLLRAFVALLVAYLLAAYVLLPVAWRRYSKRHPALDTAPRITHTANDQDERYRRMVVGAWQDEYQGKRTLSLREDGTGRMTVELSGLTASLFASRLRFEMVWSIEKGRLKKRTVGGEPAQQVQLILKTMGDRVDEPILELTEERLLLLDQDGKTKYDWRRMRTEP